MSSHSSGTTVYPATHKEVRIVAPPSHGSSAMAAPTAADPLVQNEKAEPSKKPEKRNGFVLNPQKWNWPSFLSRVPGQLNY